MPQKDQQFFPHYSRISKEQKEKIKKLKIKKKLSSEGAALRMMIDDHGVRRVSRRDK